MSALARELGLEEGIKLDALCTSWDDLFGQPLSIHIRPHQIRESVLHMVADSPLWIEHIDFYRTEILKKLAPFGIRDFKLRAGLPSGASKKARPVRVKAPLKPVSANDLTLIEGALSGTEDEMLREHLRKLALKAFGAGR